jgi:hypothetical protein
VCLVADNDVEAVWGRLLLTKAVEVPKTADDTFGPMERKFVVNALAPVAWHKLRSPAAAIVTP